VHSQVLDMEIDGVSVRVAYLHRAGRKPPLVSLHGFGSTKEDYADLAMHPAFEDRELLFWDAPGFGASDLSDPDALSIPFLVKTSLAVLDAPAVDRFHLSGHSMGGLTALFLAHEHADRVCSFLDIEGNLASEDCFLSRQIIEHPAETPRDFAKGFVERIRARPEFGSGIYAAALPAKVRDTTYKLIFTSMVDLSDNAPLMEIFTSLCCPRCFIHGAQNSHLSYLPTLPAKGVEVVEIPQSGHFPMYSNPPALWAVMAEFLERHDP
jgi:pimeloyl-ACP methyl ester carboxylesterase